MRKTSLALAAVSLSLFALPALAVEDGIAAQCAADWPGDFAMQEFCAKQQAKGREQFIAATEALDSDSPLQPAAEKCLDDWQNEHGQDWAMVNFCFEQQVKSFERLSQ